MSCDSWTLWSIVKGIHCFSDLTSSDFNSLQTSPLAVCSFSHPLILQIFIEHPCMGGASRHRTYIEKKDHLRKRHGTLDVSECSEEKFGKEEVRNWRDAILDRVAKLNMSKKVKTHQDWRSGEIGGKKSETPVNAKARGRCRTGIIQEQGDPWTGGEAA